MKTRRRKNSTTRIHHQLSSALHHIQDTDISSSYMIYTIDYGLFHALSIPQERLAYQKIEEWLYWKRDIFQKKP